MPRRVNASRVKVSRNYEVEEAAEVLGVTPQTIRRWIKQGLPAITEKRPFLIIGWQLKEYLKERATERKLPMAEDEFFCLGCKAHRKPALGLTEIEFRPNGAPILKGFCEVCEVLCRRFLPIGPQGEAGSAKKRIP